MSVITMDKSWKSVLSVELEKEYFQRLTAEISADYLLNNPPIYPPKSQLFTALKLTKFSEVKVVILGQDPYHGPRQAHGLSFSVPEDVTVPPSLKIFSKNYQPTSVLFPHYQEILPVGQSKEHYFKLYLNCSA